ncbi:hypothetical protein AKH00_16770 [Microbacterium sp. GCS4]|nr:hypothetical protein AKH00_16770 [Microbacterium sp. GCS4]
MSEVKRWLSAMSVEDRFLQVDEIDNGFALLVAEAPDVASTRRIGTSRLGEPLLLTTVGSGHRDAVVVSGVHPNEVACFQTAAQLARLATFDAEFRAAYDYTWHFVHNLDPDGSRLNERWFDRPGDFDAYTKDFFRPAPDAQPEWTFPTAYRDAYFDRMLPETQALARVIDELRPELYVSLHGSEAGGAYWYVSQWDPELMHDLHDVARFAGVDVDQGEAESAHMTQLADGVYLASRFAAEYDAAVAAEEDPTLGFLGSSSTEYAAAHGAATLIPEVPYWTHAVTPTGKTSESHASMLSRTAQALGDVASSLNAQMALVRADMTIPSPFWSASEAFIPLIAEDAASDLRRVAVSTEDRPATAAETASRETRVRGFVLRYGGMFRRALKVQVDAGLASPAVRTALATVSALVDEWLRRGEPVPLKPLSVNAMVMLQAGSVLVFANEIARRRSTAALAHS